MIKTLATRTRINLVLAPILLVLLASCDPYYQVGVWNESEEQISVQVTFNEESANFSSLDFFINNFPNLTPVEVDSATNTLKYILSNGDYLPLYGRIAVKPDFSEFHKLTIVQHYDSLIYQGKNEIMNAFDHSAERVWEIIITDE